MPHVKAKVIPGADDRFNSTRKQSVGAQFRHSLMVLMERLYSANPHFVRCIKPNSQKEPGVVDNEMVLLQLRYNGLLETIRIRRDGFSWRPFFEEFAERYAILLVKPDVSLTKESCLEILQSTELKGWICGKSRLFFKYWHQEQLAKCVERLERAAVVIQKVYRGFRCKKSYVKLVAELRAQAQHLQKLAERERRQQLALEAEAQKRSHFPVPMPRKRHSQPNPNPSDKSQQPPVPRPRSKLKESTPFDNFLDPSVPHPVLRTEEHTGEEAEMRKIKRGATLRWFRETQAEKVVQDDGAFPSWLHGMISRREAENLLRDKPLGCFLVRISQSQPGYILTYRGQDRCRHYMIQVQPNARYIILREDRAHASLTALVRYHQTVGIQPFMEILTVPCAQKSSNDLDYENLEYPTLSSPEGKVATPSQKEPRPSMPSISKPVLPWFRKSKNFQNQQTLDKSRTNPSSRESRQQAFPRLRSSIRLAMQEIQQFNSYSVNVPEQGQSSRHR
ncbi:SH2 domain-containing protein 4B-like isoform X2 [Myiozetetes cayanensis]|uniref:SH2 domain-containing protein 4B-like isoform X2 n=1 Tax=Myiozetetes cayanensis TaxID=478635 RepID=UPI00215EA33F|nr:SH2 domain-containing protein 4B-like isoform X2 [Myiozetetes cayanensis]XP_050185826.1 SH2 domain-containing protein 4B-like isoform X2 [Myiozetetes cayanensis]XP_050185827.1 SH2 domain-containing protein 4B-like isoform X2 [Myiozetetes cayanensis]